MVSSSPIIFLPLYHQPGDSIYLNAAGQLVVIINFSKVAVDLLDWRAAMYSDWPGDVVDGCWSATLLDMPSMVKRFYETQMRLLLRVLAWFGLFPGCDIILAGECYQCITFTIVDRESKSLAKRKRDAEAWYKKDMEMFEGFYIRMDVSRICF